MKKNLITTVLVVLITQLGFAQDIDGKKEVLGFGINGGVTIGNYSDSYISNIGLDFYYLRNITGRFYAGATVGFTNYFGSSETIQGATIENNDLQFIPVAVSLRFNRFKNFLIGTDVGYAIGTSEGNDGGFYASPRISYVLQDKWVLYAGYRSISLDDALGSIQFGLGFTF